MRQHPIFPYPPSRAGYWAPITSTLNWCEEDYYASFYLAEFVNALTNCLFLWLGVKGLLSCRRNGHDSIFQIAFLGYLTVGLGSFLFHATLKYPMQLVDELSMIYTTCLVFYATFSYSKPTKTRILLALFLLALAIVITLYYHYIQNPIFHQNAYALLTAIVLLRSMWVMEAALRPSWRNKGLERNQQLHSYEDMRDLKILHTMWVMVAYGLATFLGGFAIWNLDNVFCSRLRGWRRKIGLPWGILLEGHGWWHLMTGIGAYMYIVWGIWLRHCLNGRQEEYQLQWPRIYSFPDVVRVSNQGKRSTNGSTKLPAAHKPYQNGMAKKIN
ncbi:alkaline ceramidase [Histoplasma ohiense]|nr:alkaline ceramidase [Histoplasma ohiense (nom. inval.)]